MKWSTRILLWMAIIAVAGMLASNIIMKEEYDRVDKNDLYWTYGILLNQPFKYLDIEGGNITRIAFQQSPNCSLRILHDWQRGPKFESLLKSFVRNDTLYVKFAYQPEDGGERNWMKHFTLVRIFSPELLSVTGKNTNFEMEKMKQKNISVNMSGKSRFEIESVDPDFDSVNVTQKDSSEVVFEMSPEHIPFSESMNIKSLTANLRDNVLLDVGHAQINNLNLHIADSSAVILTGEGLRRLGK
jgi:hypothetical protein